MPIHTGRRPLKARTAYLWWEGAWSLLQAMAVTLLLLYQVTAAHLTPVQLVVVGTFMEAACFLFEVPTSIVADLYSRRLSALLGATVVGAAFLIQGWWASFWPIALAQVVWGLGYTFISGAVEAWITDEVGADAVQPIFTRAQQIQLAATVAGIVLAGVIGRAGLRVPILVAGAGYLVLAAAMWIAMPETGFRRRPRGERETWVAMRATLATGVMAARRPGVIRSFILVALLAGASSEVVDRLWTDRVVHTFNLPQTFGIHDAATWFAIFALVSALLALFASMLANRHASGRLNDVHPGGVLALLTLVQVGGVVGFALIGSLWPALLALWARDAAQAVAWPVRSAWLNRNVGSSARATTISITSQADAFGQVAGGPPLGALASRTSIPVGMLVSAVVLAPAAAVYARLRPNEQERAHDERRLRSCDPA